MCLRRPSASITALMSTARTLGRALAEQTVALLALPAHDSPWLSPDAAKLLERLLHVPVVVVAVAVGCNVSGIASGPLVALGGLARTSGAAHMAAGGADGGRGRHEQGVAPVAGAAHSLGGGLVGELVAVACGDGEELLLPGRVDGVLLLVLDLGLVGGRLLLGVAGTVLAALVLALHAHFVVAIQGAAEVAAAVDAHADGLLDTGDHGSRGSSSEPLVRLERQSVLGEQGAGSLLLHGSAVNGWGGLDRCECGCGCRGMDAGGGRGISRTAMDTISRGEWELERVRDELTQRQRQRQQQRQASRWPPLA